MDAQATIQPVDPVITNTDFLEPLVDVVEPLLASLQSFLGLPSVQASGSTGGITLFPEGFTQKEKGLTLLIVGLVLYIASTKLYEIQTYVRTTLVPWLFKPKKKEKSRKGNLSPLSEEHLREYKDGLEIVVSKYQRKLPASGWKAKPIEKRLESIRETQQRKLEQKTYSGGVFKYDSATNNIYGTAAQKFVLSDLAYPDRFPGSRQLEVEAASMVLNLFHPKEDSGALFTSGASESLLIALLAHRRYYGYTKGITDPEIVVAETASPQLLKACDLLAILPRRVPVNKKTALPSVEGYEQLINRNTICIVVSAPDSTYGVFHPIKELGAVSKNSNVPILVDATHGSVLLPFLHEADPDANYPQFDFRNEQISAIVCDLGNYGLAPKGSSVVLFANSTLQKTSYYIDISNHGEFHCSARLQESRSSFAIVTAWSALMHNGQDGYLALTRDVLKSTKKLVKKINANNSLEVIGEPLLGQVAFKSVDSAVDIFSLGNYLANNSEWIVEGVARRAALRITLTPENIDNLSKLFTALTKGVEEVKNSSKKYTEGPFTAFGKLLSSEDKQKYLVALEKYHATYSGALYEEKLDNKGKKKAKKR